MKKVLIAFLGIVLFISCDPPAYYDYYITNNCNEEIEVTIKVCTLNCSSPNGKIQKIDLQINPNKTQLIHSSEAILPLEDRMIEYFFKGIIIIKGNDTSKVNYINKNLWDYRETSKYNAESYLTVKPEDFE
jgi:hypothetical protein